MNLLRYKIPKYIIILSGLLYLIQPIEAYSERLPLNLKSIREDFKYKKYKRHMRRKKENEIIFRGNILYGLGNSSNKKYTQQLQ